MPASETGYPGRSGRMINIMIYVLMSVITSIIGNIATSRTLLPACIRRPLGGVLDINLAPFPLQMGGGGPHRKGVPSPPHPSFF